MDNEDEYYDIIMDDENEHKELIKTLGGFERYVAMLSVVHSFSQDGLEFAMTEEPTTKEAMFLHLSSGLSRSVQTKSKNSRGVH